MSQLAEAISYFRSLDEWGERAREGIQGIVKKYAKPVGSKTAPTVKATPKAAPKAASSAPTVKAQARPARQSVKVSAKPKAQLHAVTSLARRPVMGAGAPCPKGSIRIGAHCHTDTGRTKKPRKPRKAKVQIQKQGAGSPPPMGVTRKLVDPLAKKFASSAKKPSGASGSPSPTNKLTRRPLASTGSAGKPKATFIPPTRQRAARKPVGAHPVTGAPHDRYSMLLARRKQQKTGVPGKVKT